MKTKSRFAVSVRAKAVTSATGIGSDAARIEAQNEARPSAKTGPSGETILTIAGPGLWGRIVLNKREAARLSRELAGKVKSETAAGTKTYFFARKAKQEAVG